MILFKIKFSRIHLRAEDGANSWNSCRRKAKAFSSWLAKCKRRSTRFVYLRSVIYDRPLSVQPSAASGDTVIPFTHGLCQSIPTTIMARLNSAVRLVPACYFDLIPSNSSRNVSIGRFRFGEGRIPSFWEEEEKKMAFVDTYYKILWILIIGFEKLAHTLETRSLRTRDFRQILME